MTTFAIQQAAERGRLAAQRVKSRMITSPASGRRRSHPHNRASGSEVPAGIAIYGGMAQHLYFIRNEATRLIKIGIAGNVEERRLTLERLGGARMVTLRIVEDGWTLERWLHTAFSSSRVIGEWFLPTRDLLKIVAGECGDIREYLSVAGPRERRACEVIG